MLRKETCFYLSQFLRQIADEEQNLEILRQTLGEYSRFEPYQAFQRLDRDQKSYISSQNIQEFMVNQGVRYTLDDCSLYIKHYTFQNTLEFEQFKRSIMPYENKGLNYLIDNRKTKSLKNNELLDNEVEYNLARIIDKEIQIFKKLEEFKINLANFPDFSPQDSFDTIDKYNTGYLDFDLIGEFLFKNGFDMYEDLLQGIIRFLDINNDNKIDIYEWFEQIQPRYELAKNPLTKTFNKKQQDTVQIYKNKIGTTQAFYQNTGQQLDPNKIKDAYIPINMRSKLSIQKHIKNVSDSKQKKQKQYPKIQQENIVDKLEDEVYELVRTFKQFIVLDKENERMKEELVLRNDFNITQAFRLFDIDGKGKFTSGEFENCLINMQIYPNKHELFLLLKRYDKDGDGKLNLFEFGELIVPLKQKYQNLVTECEYKNDIFLQFQEIFSSETREYFFHLLQTLMENEAVAEALRQRLNKRKNFDLKRIFQFLDNDSDGFLRPYNFNELFASYGIIINPEDLEILYARLDKNNDKLISYSEFLCECNPKSTTKFM